MNKVETNQYLLIKLNGKIVGLVDVIGRKAEIYLEEYPSMISERKNITTLDPRTMEYSIVPLNIGVLSIHRFSNKENLGMAYISQVYAKLIKKESEQEEGFGANGFTMS